MMTDVIGVSLAVVSAAAVACAITGLYVRRCFARLDARLDHLEAVETRFDVFLGHHVSQVMREVSSPRYRYEILQILYPLMHRTKTPAECDLQALLSAFDKDSLAELARHAHRHNNHYLAGLLYNLMTRVDAPDLSDIDNTLFTNIERLASA